MTRAPVRFGIIGTNVISEWFVAACRRTEGAAEPAAVLSRVATKGETFAATHGVPSATTDLATLVDLVDAFYVASPNALHHPQAMAAIAAGRHVLVEKVMGTSAAQVDEILDAARRRGVVAMEATRHLHAPTHRLVRDTLPRLGRLRQARFAKCQYSSRYDRFRAGEVPNAFDPALGNSALADIGVYVLQPALDLFGQPDRAYGSSVRLRNGFEGAGSMTLTYPDLLVELAWSKITAQVTPSYVLGEDGALTVDDVAEPSRIELHLRGQAPEVLHDAPNSPAATLHHEVLAFVDQVRAGVSDPRWSQVTRASRALMDQHLG